MTSDMKNPPLIFLGNGPLADHALKILSKNFEILYHAQTKSDLDTVKSLKQKHPESPGILASFGVILKPDLLDLFEPTGILNIHPSKLPAYRGPSPIETAILNGDTSFSVSIMKLAEKMDAGPLYFQSTLTPDDCFRPDLKSYLYENLAALGAHWLVENLMSLPAPVPQDDQKATFTTKLTKSQSLLTPDLDTAPQTLRKILAFQTFPKPKYTFYDKECIILSAHLSKEATPLSLKCRDNLYVAIDELQPLGKNPMDQKSFLNGYAKPKK